MIKVLQGRLHKLYLCEELSHKTYCISLFVIDIVSLWHLSAALSKMYNVCYVLYLSQFSGPPSPPSDIKLHLDIDVLTVSWSSALNPNYITYFNLNLDFIKPSLLGSQRVFVSDIVSYNFKINGQRSCDAFTTAIQARNAAGTGQTSYVRRSFPPLPDVTTSRFVLVRNAENGSYSLAVTTDVRILFCSY